MNCQRNAKLEKTNIFPEEYTQTSILSFHIYPVFLTTVIHQSEAWYFSKYVILMHSKTAGQRHPFFALLCKYRTTLPTCRAGPTCQGYTRVIAPAARRHALQRDGFKICKWLWKLHLSKAAGQYVASSHAAIRRGYSRHWSSFSLNKGTSRIFCWTGAV